MSVELFVIFINLLPEVQYRIPVSLCQWTVITLCI